MSTKIASISLVVAMMLMGVGCGEDATKENSEIRDARALIGDLAKHSANASSTQDNSLGTSSGFVPESSDATRPMVLDAQGNLSDGGLLKFINKEGHKVEILTLDTNQVIIKVDTNGDDVFTKDEIVTEMFEPILPPLLGNEGSIIGADLNAKLSTMEDSESITVRIDLDDVNFIFAKYLQRPSSTGGASIHDGEVRYFYNGKEVTKAEMDKIEKEYQALERERNIYRAKANKKMIEAFLVKNDIANNESINNAIESGFSHFEVIFSKREILNLVEDNKAALFAITMPLIGADG